MRNIFAILPLSLLLSGPALATDLPADPLGSVMWESMARTYYPGGKIIFDDRVKLMVPQAAEDQFFVPVTVDAGALADVEEIVVVADFNPIQRALSFKPGDAEPYIGLRLKVEQSTPIRAGVRTADGVWHMAGRIIEAAGGGCTAPAQAHTNANWMATLGKTRARVVRGQGEEARITLRIRHPMDTGLADGIPVFYLHDLAISTAEGQAVASLEAYEPVSENPTFTFKAKLAGGETALAVSGRDTEGNRYAMSIPVPAPVGN
ncbi:MAG: quinoprotein dehydrogenase-associated SoxYZ-like carrier [Mesorhizobium sp.]|nr:quinoprotein dehydrogenase-associated SoxYZ-like carrier [Mesorhizobium sp.]MBN9245258.1 quinoprotein dehydrogenase-associated SoxYZ-like carrier [Mesorhizobium sp.]